MGDANLIDIERDRPDPFVGIRLKLAPVSQHGHGAMTEEVVETLQGPPRNPFRLPPRPPFREQSFAHSAYEKWLKEELLRLVHQQVAMVLPIGRKDMGKDELSYVTSLIEILERLGRAMKFVDGVKDRRSRTLPERGVGVFLSRAAKTG
jgi:hypothetical protein